MMMMTIVVNEDKDNHIDSGNDPEDEDGEEVTLTSRKWEDKM